MRYFITHDKVEFLRWHFRYRAKLYLALQGFAWPRGKQKLPMSFICISVFLGVSVFSKPRCSLPPPGSVLASTITFHTPLNEFKISHPTHLSVFFATTNEPQATTHHPRTPVTPTTSAARSLVAKIVWLLCWFGDGVWSSSTAGKKQISFENPCVNTVRTPTRIQLRGQLYSAPVCS